MTTAVATFAAALTPLALTAPADAASQPLRVVGPPVVHIDVDQGSHTQRVVIPAARRLRGPRAVAIEIVHGQPVARLRITRGVVQAVIPDRFPGATSQGDPTSVAHSRGAAMAYMVFQIPALHARTLPFRVVWDYAPITLSTVAVSQPDAAGFVRLTLTGRGLTREHLYVRGSWENRPASPSYVWAQGSATFTVPASVAASAPPALSADGPPPTQGQMYLGWSNEAGGVASGEIGFCSPGIGQTGTYRPTCPVVVAPPTPTPAQPVVTAVEHDGEQTLNGATAFSVDGAHLDAVQRWDLDNVTVDGVASADGTTATITVPAGLTPGRHLIRTHLGMRSSEAGFTVPTTAPAAPTITSPAATSLPFAALADPSGRTVWTLHGTGFSTTSSVTSGNGGGFTFHVVDDSTLTIQVGVYIGVGPMYEDLTVYTRGGSATLRQGLGWALMPQIMRTDAPAPFSTGQVVTLLGADLAGIVSGTVTLACGSAALGDLPIALDQWGGAAITLPTDLATACPDATLTYADGGGTDHVFDLGAITAS